MFKITDSLKRDAELKLQMAKGLQKNTLKVLKAVKVRRIESLTSLDLCKQAIKEMERYIIEADHLVRTIKLSGGQLG